MTISRLAANLIVVTAPGPGSGKLATCMSNMYHDQINGIKSGYAKFETSLEFATSSPVNLAYELPLPTLMMSNMIIIPWKLSITMKLQP